MRRFVSTLIALWSVLAVLSTAQAAPAFELTRLNASGLERTSCESSGAHEAITSNDARRVQVIKLAHVRAGSPALFALASPVLRPPVLTGTFAPFDFVRWLSPANARAHLMVFLN